MTRPDRQCTATSNRTGERCRAPAIYGGGVCVKHGGSAPQVRAAADRRLAEVEAAKVLAELDVHPIGDPLQALLDLAARVTAYVDRLDAIVATLEAVRADPSKWATEQVDARIQLLERFLDRQHRVLETIAKLNLEDRMVRIDEKRMDMAGALVRGCLHRLGYDPWSDPVQAALVETLAAIEAGEPQP